MNYLETTHKIYKAAALDSLEEMILKYVKPLIIMIIEDFVKLGCHSCESRNLQIDV